MDIRFRPRTIVFSLGLLAAAHSGFSQKADTAKHILNLRGNIGATNNGFSVVPTFTLGKPALVAIFGVSGRRRLSFEPEFRYSLEDFKPWSFVFIWRYKLVRRDRFQLSVGTHLPALNFKTVSVVSDGAAKEIVQARRFFPVFEVIPNWRLGRGFSLGIYSQYGKGLEKEVSSDIYFVSLRPGLPDLPLSKRLALRFSPQVYYLRIGERDGAYVFGNLALALRGTPFSVSTMMNKAVKTNIVAKDFDWNVGVNYSFNRSYVGR